MSDDAKPGVIDLAAERAARGLAPGAPIIPHATLAPVETPCNHAQVEVDDKTRSVVCHECGVDLDPVIVLHQYAVQERQFQRMSQMRLDERKAVGLEIEELKRQRRNLRASVHRDEMVKQVAAAHEQERKAMVMANSYKTRYGQLHAQLLALGKKPCA